MVVGGGQGVKGTTQAGCGLAGSHAYLVQLLERDRELLTLCVVCWLVRELERVVQPVIEQRVLVLAKAKCAVCVEVQGYEGADHREQNREAQRQHAGQAMGEPWDVNFLKGSAALGLAAHRWGDSRNRKPVRVKKHKLRS